MTTALTTFSIGELRQEAERELLRRKRVLPNRQLTGRKPADAARQIAIMAAIVEWLREVEAAELLI